jgi:hypothetical protein
MDDILAEFVSEDVLAKQLGHHPRTVARWRQQGVGPPFVMVGREIRYSIHAARTWLAAGGTSAKPMKPRRQRRRR